jgi:hypothetical protein
VDEIAQHHAHPLGPTAAGDAPDTDYAAFPVESQAPQSGPVRMRSDSGVIVEAHRLFAGQAQRLCRFFLADANHAPQEVATILRA